VKLIRIEVLDRQALKVNLIDKKLKKILRCEISCFIMDFYLIVLSLILLKEIAGFSLVAMIKFS
jgi:hypothetical protein